MVKPLCITGMFLYVVLHICNTGLFMSEMLTVRIPEEIKNDMDKFKINWSEFIREVLKNKIIELQRDKAFKDMDSIRDGIKQSKVNMADEVIKWRKKR